MTLVEVLIAAVILATVLLGMAMFQTASLKVSSKEKDRGFAIQKAVQMMEEVLAYQVTSGTKGEMGIDALAQSETQYSFVLTIDPKVTDPKVTLSGNVAHQNGYRFVRQIRVEPISNEKGSRRISVGVFYSDGGSTPGTTGGTQPLAYVTNIVKAEATKSQPTQVYDMYLIDIENTIGVWADPNTLREIIGNTIDFLKNNNPGLEIRKHWVRRLAYGRDPYYKPIGNKNASLNNPGAVPLDWVYFYPGKLSSTSMRYNPEVLNGQLKSDGVDQNAVLFGAATNRYYTQQAPYTFADQYNHALRYPEEEEKYAVAKAGNPKEEMSLRMLFEKMSKGELHNAILVNLHAELVPVIPVRNFSDAARVPLALNQGNYIKDNFGVDEDNNTEITSGSRARLVTHPRRLKVDRNTSDSFGASNSVELRVYPYLSADYGVEPPEEYRKGQIVLRNLRDRIHRWNDNGSSYKNVQIEVLHKLPTPIVDTDTIRHRHSTSLSHYGSGAHSSWSRHTHTVTTTTPAGYHWVRIWPDNGDAMDNTEDIPYSSTLKSTYLENVDSYNEDTGKDIGDNDIIIKLKNIPYTHTVVNNYGLPGSRLLYGFNYFPDTSLPFMDNDLPDANAPRNTARFRIRFNVEDAGRYDVLTTIGKEDKLQRHQYPNRSTTYQWVDTAVPFSEQYQIVGDPRLYPYEDTITGGESIRTGFNRYFADLTSGAYYNGSTQSWNAFPASANTWSGVDVDLPRQLELWRRGLLSSNGVYLNPAGFSFYYTGLGGEIMGETRSSKPYNGGSATVDHYEFGEARLIARADNGWYSKLSHGELFPDDQWENWKLNGNLPTATGNNATSYRRKLYSNVPNYLPGGNPDRGRPIGAQGSVSFFNGGSAGNSSNWFSHLFHHGKSQLTTNGQSVANSFKLYLDTEYDSYRPFLLDQDSAYQPQDWTSAESVAWRTKLEWGLTTGANSYYKQDNHAIAQSVAPIVMRRNGQAGYAVMSAAAPSGDSGTTTLARLSIAASLQAFFDLASPTYEGGGDKGHQAIKLLPRIKIIAPVEDTQLTGNSAVINWQIFWNRWNGEAYSTMHSNYGSSLYKPDLVYNLKYSTDGGASWRFLNGNETCRAGVFYPAKARYGGAATGTYTWNYGGWQNREYLIRLECYRDRDGYRDTHYAYHQVAYTIAH
jgi:hypothetical protein